MSYLTQTRIAADPILILRVAACAASEGIPDPRFWAQENITQLATTGGWATKYAESTDEDPGADEAAIDDGMILAAVQQIIPAETPPEPLPDPAE